MRWLFRLLAQTVLFAARLTWVFLDAIAGLLSSVVAGREVDEDPQEKQNFTFFWDHGETLAGGREPATYDEGGARVGSLTGSPIVKD